MQKLDFCLVDGFANCQTFYVSHLAAKDNPFSTSIVVNYPLYRFSTRIRTALAALMVCLAMSGCVNRRLIVRTEPEGAFVTMDGVSLGYTPLAAAYTYGGSRDIQIEKDGYETVKQKVDLRDPIYLRPPFSFIPENFSPVEIRHQPVLDFQLQPKQRVSSEVLLQRAATLRGNVQRGTLTVPDR